MKTQIEEKIRRNALKQDAVDGAGKKPEKDLANSETYSLPLSPNLDLPLQLDLQLPSDIETQN